MEASRVMMVVVDYDNLRRGHDLLDTEKYPRWLMEQMRALGEVALAYVFVDTKTMSYEMARGLTMQGFFLVHCPKLPVGISGELKDTVDGLAIEKIHQLLRLCPGLTTLVMVSGDRDYVPCLATWAGRGKEIIVAAGSGLSTEMVGIAHRVVRLDHSASSPPITQPYTRAFCQLLVKGQVADYGALQTGSIVGLRDKVVSYFQTVVLPMVRDGSASMLTRTFLQNGLLSQDGRPKLSRADIDLLLATLTRTALDEMPEGIHEPSYYPSCDHPFIKYVESLPVTASSAA